MRFLPTRRLVNCLIALCGTGALHAADQATAAAPAAFKQYCVQCHGKSKPMGGVSIEQLISRSSVADHFQQWQKVAAVLEERRMPPEKMPQPNDADRQNAVKWIRTRLAEYAKKHDGDPGRVTVRRLTSAEYAFSIEDLTGLDLKLDRNIIGDAAGGADFLAPAIRALPEDFVGVLAVRQARERRRRDVAFVQPRVRRVGAAARRRSARRGSPADAR